MCNSPGCSVPAAVPTKPPRSLPALTNEAKRTCVKAQKVGDSRKFSNSREGSVALKVFCRSYWNLGLAGSSLVSADANSRAAAKVKSSK